MTTIELEVSQIYGFDTIVKPLSQNMYILLSEHMEKKDCEDSIKISFLWRS